MHADLLDGCALDDQAGEALLALQRTVIELSGNVG
jgi:hypothetical protein